MSNSTVHSSSEPATAEPVPQPYSLRRYLLVIGLMLLFGGLIWMWVGFGARSFKDVDAQRADERYKIYDGVLQADQKTLNGPPSVLNKEQSKIRLPLGDAINLTLRDINANKPHAAYPVQQTNPAPNPAPPADAKAPQGGQAPNTSNANNPVLPKQGDATGSNAPNGNASPAPSPGAGTPNPR